MDREQEAITQSTVERIRALHALGKANLNLSEPLLDQLEDLRTEALERAYADLDACPITTYEEAFGVARIATDMLADMLRSDGLEARFLHKAANALETLCR
ncbi:hypothetical protein LGR44_16490 [Microvirga sp. SM9]|nr:hypothetical protein [Microvirga lenta]